MIAVAELNMNRAPERRGVEYSGARNVGRNNCPCKNNCDNIINRLQTIDFAIVETVLYLDSYPDCAEALHNFRKLTEERKGVVAAYESECGPLTCSCGNDICKWRWTDGPWPWELSFPGNGGKNYR